MHGLAIQFDLARYCCTRFSFAHSTQEKDRLRGTQVRACEHGAAVECVDPSAFSTTIDGEFASLQFAKDARVLYASLAMRTLQTMRVKILEQPDGAHIVIE